LAQGRQRGLKGDKVDQLDLVLKLNSDPENIFSKPALELLKLYNLGKLQDGINYGLKLLNQFPKDAFIHSLLGAFFTGAGAYDRGVEYCQKSIELCPLYARSYNTMGIALKELGSYAGALESYRRAIEIDPFFEAASNNLALLLESVTISAFSQQIANCYLHVLEKKRSARPFGLAPKIISFLKKSESIESVLLNTNPNSSIENLARVCQKLAETPLFLKIIEISVIPDLEIEKFLKQARKTILLNIHKSIIDEELIGFQTSLALHCLTNEYLYGEDEEETAAIKTLEDSIERAISKSETLPLSLIVCLASYRPLNEYLWVEKIKPSFVIKELFNRQVYQTNKEKKLRGEMEILNIPNDLVSVNVKKQYEENPYPRWVHTKLFNQALSVSDIFKKLDLSLRLSADMISKTPNILIAGCGTGEHSLITASRFKDCRVTAIDLSLSSLSYAKFKTEEFQVKNIKYMQADILNLHLIDKRFDIIESVGVLHHMENPKKGWKILVDLLKPGGLMRIGLYSQLARKSINKVRELIKKQQVASDKNSMLEFRNSLLKDDDFFGKDLMNNVDFWSVSSLRDLLFHTEEHQFTIPQISRILNEFDLQFAGFEFPTAEVIYSFREVNPDKAAIFNLDLWADFEKKMPNTFINMYQFWVQKY